MVSVSPKPISMSSMLDPDSMKSPSREKETATQVDEVGFPLRLKDGTHSERMGVRKMSKPAMKPTLEADDVAMPLLQK